MHWWWRPHVNLKWRCVSTSRHGVTFQKNFHIHLLGNCKFWTLGQPFKFSGHYMYHSSVVTIRTTAQWSLYAPQFSGHYMHHSSVVTICTTKLWHHIYFFRNILKIITDISLIDWSNGRRNLLSGKERKECLSKYRLTVNTGWLQSSLSKIKIEVCRPSNKSNAVSEMAEH